MRQALRPLRTRPFGRLLTSYTLNHLGDRVGVVALAVLVYAETQDAVATAALFVASQFVPAFLAPAAVARLDQLPLRRALPGIYWTEALLFALLAVLAGAFWLPAVLVLALLDGVLMLSARALIRATINAALEHDGLLREGNGLVNVGFAVAGVLGAALGGLLVDVWGPTEALAADAVTFIAVGALLASTSSLPAGTPTHEGVLERLEGGLRFAWGVTRIRGLLVAQALAFVFFTLIVPIEVIYAEETLGTNEGGFGLLLAAWGAGTLVGSVVFLASTRRNPIALAAVATLAIGAAYLIMGATSSLAVACAASVLGGIGNGVQWVSVVTAIQELTPPELQARTVGLLESVAAAMLGVGYLLGGAITAIFDPPTAFFVAGAGIIAIVAAAALLRLRPRRRPAAPSGAA